MAPLITRAIRRQLITAARHFDQHAVIPGHGEIVAMAPAAIYSCVVGDSCTEEAIDHELADIGAAPDVASTSAVMATRSAPFPVNRREFVAVIRRHVLGDSEPSAWTTLGRAAAAVARIARLVMLYSLRFALAPPQTARGLRRMVLDAAPLPAGPKPSAPGSSGPPLTKKAVLLALYRAHPDYGDRSTASRVAAELAAQAELQPGTARTYLYAELNGRAS